MDASSDDDPSSVLVSAASLLAPVRQPGVNVVKLFSFVTDDEA
jgi:hypothetical protein